MLGGAAPSRVGFQGERGAFSEQAARALFEVPIEAAGYRDFDALVRAVDAGDVEYGLLPCENSIYGPIARAYDLLLGYPALCVVDETSLPIVQCLIGAPGSTLDSIDRVLSHPVALEQCGAFLKARPRVRVEPAEDTAGAVRSVVERGDRGIAAIGPALAAELYGGVLLAEAIADERENVTRFLAISRDPQSRRNLGRLCVSFSLSHEPGSLYRALGGIAEQNLNLRSLIARPKRGTPFEYCFVAELDWPPHLGEATLAIAGARDLRLLGRY